MFYKVILQQYNGLNDRYNITLSRTIEGDVLRSPDGLGINIFFEEDDLRARFVLESNLPSYYKRVYIVEKKKWYFFESFKQLSENKYEFTLIIDAVASFIDKANELNVNRASLLNPHETYSVDLNYPSHNTNFNRMQIPNGHFIFTNKVAGDPDVISGSNNIHNFTTFLSGAFGNQTFQTTFNFTGTLLFAPNTNFNVVFPALQTINHSGSQVSTFVNISSSVIRIPTPLTPPLFQQRFLDVIVTCDFQVRINFNNNISLDQTNNIRISIAPSTTEPNAHNLLSRVSLTFTSITNILRNTTTVADNTNALIAQLTTPQSNGAPIRQILGVKPSYIFPVTSQNLTWQGNSYSVVANYDRNAWQIDIDFDTLEPIEVVYFGDSYLLNKKDCFPGIVLNVTAELSPYPHSYNIWATTGTFSQSHSDSISGISNITIQYEISALSDFLLQNQNAYAIHEQQRGFMQATQQLALQERLLRIPLNSGGSVSGIVGGISGLYFQNERNKLKVDNLDTMFRLNMDNIAAKPNLRFGGQGNLLLEQTNSLGIFINTRRYNDSDIYEFLEVNGYVCNFTTNWAGLLDLIKDQGFLSASLTTSSLNRAEHDALEGQLQGLYYVKT